VVADLRTNDMARFPWFFKRALLFTCVGVPAYTSARGGPPGAPAAVRGVTTRILRRPQESPPARPRIHPLPRSARPPG
jgi:hypothetical protein